MRHTYKNGTHFKNIKLLRKWVTPTKMGQALKNGNYLEKWVTLGKICQT